VLRSIRESGVCSCFAAGLRAEARFLITGLRLLRFGLVISFFLGFYKGFNKDRAAPGRYANANNKTNEYCGIRLVGTAPLDAIPDDWKKIMYGKDE